MNDSTTVEKPTVGPIWDGNLHQTPIPVEHVSEPSFNDDWGCWEVFYRVSEDARANIIERYHEWTATWDSVAKRWYANSE